MAHFLVFAGRKWENVMGKKGMTWDIAGVYDAPDENTACLVAAQKQGVGTCFAVSGYAWGVDTVQAEASSELGVEPDAITRLERMGAQLTERLAKALPAPSRQQLDEGDTDG